MNFELISHFDIGGTVKSVQPLGNGLINDTYKVETAESGAPDYVLQKINNAVFQDVDLLQHNIEVVTHHIRRKLEARGENDIDRKVLRFVPLKDSVKTYYEDAEGHYWRMSVFIPRAITREEVTPESSYCCGKAFGNFESMLVDVPEQLGETIPDFHNMELRRRQLEEAVRQDKAGRVAEVKDILDELERDADEMCRAERLYREGKLPKRICHCDTKVNNMMFDENGQVLCVIDLDTVMPSFVFSDYGDFLRTAANTVAEDDPNMNKVAFRDDIFKSFTRGYLESAGSFLTPIEIENLPYAAALFPYMQCVRFLTDYLNGDTYYKIKYPEHNLVRTRNQLALYRNVRQHDEMMREYISQLSATSKQDSCLNVPKLDVAQPEPQSIPKIFQKNNVEYHTLENVDWPESYPYKPLMRFAIAHNGRNILIHYVVEEKCVRAVAPSDNGHVWEDSCCELFLQPETIEDNPALGGVYYNMECNCAGKLLVACGPGRGNREQAPLDVVAGVRRWSSLGNEPFDCIEAKAISSDKVKKDILQAYDAERKVICWQMALVIPAATLFNSRIDCLDGRIMRGNIYKCGDKTAEPHFLSFFPIHLPKPDFHRPEFFREMAFE